MLLVILKETGEVKFKVDGWLFDCVDKAENFIIKNGYECLGHEISITGNLIIYIK